MALIIGLWVPGILHADILRIATDDPGLTGADPGFLLLTGIDFDHDLRTWAALAGVPAGQGVAYPYRPALRPDSGMAAGLDMDGDGRRGGARDVQGNGRFAGHGGRSVLSKLPVLTEGVQDFSEFLWRDLPGANLGGADPGAPGEEPVFSESVRSVQRLASVGFWSVPVQATDGSALTLLAYSATPSVLDGPEDRNGRRNHDETAFWLRYLGRDLVARGPGYAPPEGPVVVLGKANVDPTQGEGRSAALAALLAHPRLTDPAPLGADGRVVTVDWLGDTAADVAAGRTGPGDLRVSYVLPDRRLRVTGAGVFWPTPGAPLADAVAAASAHRLVWVDLALPGPP